MGLSRTPQAVFDKVQEQLRAEIAANEPTLANVDAGTTEHDLGILRFRNMVFSVPPVPYKQAIWLSALSQELRRLSTMEYTPEIRDRATDVVNEIVTIMNSLIRPGAWWQKLVWRIRGNPFSRVDIAELNMLLNFFCTARMRCDVRATWGVMSPGFLQQMWPEQKRRLQIGIRAGWERMAIHAVGDTT